MIIAYYSQRRVEIYKLGFFIQRAKSQLCVQGKYTTVASYTELPPCGTRSAEARLSFKHAPGMMWRGKKSTWRAGAVLPGLESDLTATPAAWATIGH